MKTIRVPTTGSSRDLAVEKDPDSTVRTVTMLASYRLWRLPPEGRLAYVQPCLDQSGARPRVCYRVHLSDRVVHLTADQWHRLKRSAEQTDALAEVGAEGPRLLDLARQGRIATQKAIARMERPANQDSQTDLPNS